MQNKTIYSLACLLVSQILGISSVWAQIDKDALGYYEDAFRFSRPTSVIGSSRIQAIGGAQTAIGGDLANITGNPAGLGAFRKSAVSIGFGIGNAGTNASYFTQKENPNAALAGGKGLGNLNHLAGVVSIRPEDSEEGGLWKGATFGFSVARTNNFQNQYAFSGKNSLNSKTDSYVDGAWNIPESQFQNTTQFNTGIINYLRPAYYAFLLGVPEIPDPNTPYFTYFRNANERMIAPIQQDGTVETKGGQHQWNFAFAGNVADKFHFGFSAGMTTLNYQRYGIYKESINNSSSLLNKFTEYDSLQVKGTGINFSMGVMVRPIKFLRLGASFAAPTTISLQETFGSTFESHSFAPNNVLTVRKESATPGSYTYRLRTPARMSGGLTFLIPNLEAKDGFIGFLTAEVEYVAYTTMNLKDFDAPDTFIADNNTIRNLYKNVLNYKFGAEFTYNNFYVRGGYAYQPDAMNTVDFVDRTLKQITGGLGVMFKNYSFDFSLVNTSFNTANTPYSINTTSDYGKKLTNLGVNMGNSPYSEIKHNVLQGTITFTVKFPK